VQAYLGVDAGGSHTRAVVVSAEGEVLGYGWAGPANFRTNPIEVARAAVVEAVGMAVGEMAAAHPVGPEVVAAFIGSAGLEEPGDEGLARELLGGVVAPHQVRIDSDVLAAWAGAFAGAPGIVVSAGTGSICLGVTSSGNRVRAGGWGPVFGDEGSAYAIARRGVKAALASVDGRGPKTSLLPEFFKFLGFETELGSDVLELHGANLTGWLYGAGRTQADIARFAPLVEDAALRDDPAAVEILERAGGELAVLVAAVIRRWGAEGEAIPVSTSGAILRRSSLVRESFLATLDEMVLSVEVRDPLFTPEIGSVLLAMELAGRDRSEAILRRINESAAVIGRSVGAA